MIHHDDWEAYGTVIKFEFVLTFTKHKIDEERLYFRAISNECTVNRLTR
jgi:hypothetical protein